MNLEMIELALDRCASWIEFDQHCRADLEDAWRAVCNIREVGIDHHARLRMRRILDNIEDHRPYATKWGRKGSEPLAIKDSYPLSRTSFHRTG